MRKFETILIKNPKTGKKMSLVLKGDKVDKLLCSCDGKYTKASECNPFVFDAENRTVTCPECGKELEIIETPAERESRKEAEADEHYFNPDFGKGNVVTYTVTDTEIIQCRHMGDFKTGVAIPYTENLENLIKEFYILNEEFWG